MYWRSKIRGRNFWLKLKFYYTKRPLGTWKWQHNLNWTPNETFLLVKYSTVRSIPDYRLVLQIKMFHLASNSNSHMDLIQLWFYEKVRTTAFVKYRVPYSPKLTLKNGLKLDNFADFLQHNEYLSRSMNEVGEIELHLSVWKSPKSLVEHCERSELRLHLSGQKFMKNAQNSQFCEFLKVLMVNIQMRHFSWFYTTVFRLKR